MGLAVYMRDIPQVRRVVRLCMGLPLLPRGMMRTGLLVIRQEALDEGNYIFQLVEPFLLYIYTTWLRSDRTCDRLTVYGCLRTNNACESQNHAVNEALPRHPNTYAFIGNNKPRLNSSQSLPYCLTCSAPLLLISVRLIFKTIPFSCVQMASRRWSRKLMI